MNTSSSSVLRGEEPGGAGGGSGGGGAGAGAGVGAGAGGGTESEETSTAATERYDQTTSLPPLSVFRRSEYARPSSSHSSLARTRITLVIVAALAALALLFVVLYLRYKRCVARRMRDREEYLIRAGRLQLRRRWLDVDGTLRQDEFYPEKYCDMNKPSTPTKKEDDDDDDDDEEEGDNIIKLDDVGFGPDITAEKLANNGSKQTSAVATGKKKKSVAQQLLKTVTSGKLLHVINNTMVKGKKKLGERFAQPALTTEERDRMEAHMRLADESVNPLYPIRVKQAELERAEAEEEARIAQEQAEKLRADHEAAQMQLESLAQTQCTDYSQAALDAFDAFGDADTDDPVVAAATDK
jgi:hypothetical protein